MALIYLSRILVAFSMSSKEYPFSILAFFKTSPIPWSTHPLILTSLFDTKNIFPLLDLLN